jgi:minor extracellular serine protease Vpr
MPAINPVRAAMIFAAGLALSMATTSAIAAPNKLLRNGDLAYSGPSVDTSTALVQLNGDPLSTYVKTKPAHGKKIDFANSTVKSYRAQLSALRNQFKQWLQTNAPKARITGSWDVSLNAVSVQLNGTALAVLQSAPQVKHAEYQGLYHPNSAPPGTDPDLALIGAKTAWASAAVGGSGSAGKGVRIAIIDTGIDITNPCFSETGFPATTQLGDHASTNNKVIVAKVFNNKSPSLHYTAAPIQDHGTHVAGTAACNIDTPASVSGATIPYLISGVAPAAQLGSYNIFPGDVTDARSEDILNALDAAYADGMDVANMSLGGGAHGIQDLLTIAVDNLDAANMVVAVAAGNEGDGDDTAHPPLPPGHYTVGSPGSAARALTAGSFTVGHAVRSLVKQFGTFYASEDGDFAVPAADLTGPTIEAGGAPVALVGNHNDGCASYGPVAAGSIVLVARGACTFADKVHNAQAAGAAGVIIVNRDNFPIPMADDPALGNTIPAVMVGHDDGLALYGSVPANATITAPLYVSQDPPILAPFAPDANVQSSFSSQGPTDVDFRIKPDVMAPGENVVSSVPAASCAAPPCFAVFSGTSMATPHLAGSAAVVRAAHPDWDAWEVRSAIVNTADRGIITAASDGTTILTDPNIVGAGRENLSNAVDPWVALDPVSVSFGSVPSNAGKTLAYVVKMKNERGTLQTYSLSVGGGGGGVTYSLSTGSVSLAPGATGTFTVFMTAAKGAVPGDHNGELNVSGGSGSYAHAGLYTFIK